MLGLNLNAEQRLVMLSPYFGRGCNLANRCFDQSGFTRLSQKLWYVCPGGCWFINFGMAHNTSRNNLRQDLEAKQRNILWPDTLTNARRVDEFLWKGSPSPSGVQRIGTAIFGLFYLGIAAFFLIESIHSHALLWLLVGILWAAFGGKIAMNAFRRKKVWPTEIRSDAGQPSSSSDDHGAVRQEPSALKGRGDSNTR
jgi:hypothetical protein